MTLKDIWLQHQLQQLAEIAKILDREQKIAQRREQNQIFQQQMAQQLHAFRQEYDQRQKLWEEFCQKALEEEQQRQTKIAERHEKALKEKQQRQTEIAERRQEVAQKLCNFREEDLLRQKLVRQIHEKALEEKQQRQTEIAERRQEVARQKQRNQQEILAIREYVWGSQAEAVSLTKS